MKALLVFASIVVGGSSLLDAEGNPLQLTQISSTVWAIEWEGIAGRTYFLQGSPDLQNWEFDMEYDFGAGTKTHGFSGSSPRMFFRLVHEDDATVFSFDEVAWADPDHDGLPTAWELANGMHPMSSDLYAAFLSTSGSSPAPAFEVFTPLQ